MKQEATHVLTAEYHKKDESYFTSARRDYVNLLPDNRSARILELGCGDGATGELALRSGKAGEYVGIESFEPMAMRARSVLTEVIIGDVERTEFNLAEQSFDALILSEVLEHLTNPAQTLLRLIRFLKPGALVFASSPNISHWKNVLNLARGRFEYADSGMMDRTHLKWFTPATFEKMFIDAGVTVTYLEPLNKRRRLLTTLVTIIPGLKSMTFFQIDLHGRYEPNDAKSTFD